MLGWRTRTNLGRTVWFHFFTFLSPSALMIASKWQGWLVPDMPTQLLRGCIWHHQALPARIGSGHPQLKSAVRWRCWMGKELFKMHTHLYLSSYIYIYINAVKPSAFGHLRGDFWLYCGVFRRCDLIINAIGLALLSGRQVAKRQIARKDSSLALGAII